VERVLTESELSRYQEPVFTLDASLHFPEVKSAKVVLERMKQLDKFIQVKADANKGILVFRVDTEVVSTRTTFNGLKLSSEEVSQDTGESQASELNKKQRHQFVVCSVGSKELSSVLLGISNFGKKSTGTMIGIIRRAAICLHTTFDDESHITYYLATSAMNGDDDPDLENNQLLRFETVKEEEE